MKQQLFFRARLIEPSCQSVTGERTPSKWEVVFADTTVTLTDGQFKELKDHIIDESTNYKDVKSIIVPYIGVFDCESTQLARLQDYLSLLGE